jgi:glycosyltransferase involved in cell wall biosynthesis
VKRLRDAGCDVVATPAAGLMKWLAKPAVHRVAKAFSPNASLAWMNRAAVTLPRKSGVVNAGRLGGYYKLKNYRRCDHLIGNTPGIVEYLRKEGWPHDHAHLISNFGEVADMTDACSLREELSIPHEHRVLLNLGRLHENKAQDILIRALVDVENATALIAGEGPLRGELERLANACGVADRVRFLGWRTDTANLFRTADACVFPSRAEPLGNVILEAWALGVPVVSVRSDGPSWLIDSEENGLLVDIDDADALAVATNRLLDDEDLRNRCVGNGKAKFESEFSKDVIVRRYLEFFDAVRA